MKIALVLEAIITNPLVAHLACSWQYVSAYDEQDGVSLSLCSTETKKNVFLSITESENQSVDKMKHFFMQKVRNVRCLFKTSFKCKFLRILIMFIARET